MNLFLFLLVDKQLVCSASVTAKHVLLSVHHHHHHQHFHHFHCHHHRYTTTTRRLRSSHTIISLHQYLNHLHQLILLLLLHHHHHHHHPTFLGEEEEEEQGHHHHHQVMVSICHQFKHQMVMDRGIIHTLITTFMLPTHLLLGGRDHQH